MKLTIVDRYAGTVTRRTADLREQDYQDLYIGDTDIATFILEGFDGDQVAVHPVRVGCDGSWNAHMVSVSFRKYSSGYLELLHDGGYTLLETMYGWLRIFDDTSRNVTLEYDPHVCLGCRVFQQNDTGELMLVFITYDYEEDKND